MKYQLIVITDRELEEPKYYDTFEEAYQAMVADVAMTVDTDVAHLCEHEDYESGFYLYDDSAWVSAPFRCNVDWQIIPLSEKISEKEPALK